MNLESTRLVSHLKNWAHGTTANSLENVHNKDVNIAIWERSTNDLAAEISALLKQNIELRASGTLDTVLNDITVALNAKHYPRVLADVKKLLKQFSKITKAEEYRLLLTTVNTNMCRRFHTDINDLRLLCTYSGPGTLWLTEDNIDRKALDSSDDNDCIVIDENKVQRVKTGSVALLKGALFPQEGTRAIVHRSPTIEESGETRLLLRIDTNDFLNFN